MSVILLIPKSKRTCTLADGRGLVTRPPCHALNHHASQFFKEMKAFSSVRPSHVSLNWIKDSRLIMSPLAMLKARFAVQRQSACSRTGRTSAENVPRMYFIPHPVSVGLLSLAYTESIFPLLHSPRICIPKSNPHTFHHFRKKRIQRCTDRRWLAQCL